MAETVPGEALKEFPRSFGRQQTGYNCDVCCMSLSSQLQLKQHVQGKTHNKRVKAKQRMQALESNSQPVDHLEVEEPGLNSEAAPKKRKIIEIPCKVCGMIFNNQLIAKEHFASDKHLKKLAQVSEFKLGDVVTVEDQPPVYKSDSSQHPIAPGSGLMDPTKTAFYCQFCKKQLNSQPQYDQHRAGALHQAKVEEKRVKKTVHDWHKRGRFPCENCQKFFANSVLLREHVKSDEHRRIVRHQNLFYGGEKRSGPYGPNGGMDNRQGHHPPGPNYGQYPTAYPMQQQWMGQNPPGPPPPEWDSPPPDWAGQPGYQNYEWNEYSGHQPYYGGYEHGHGVENPHNKSLHSGYEYDNGHQHKKKRSQNFDYEWS